MINLCMEEEFVETSGAIETRRVRNRRKTIPPQGSQHAYILSDCLLVFLVAEDSMEEFSGVLVDLVHNEIVQRFAEIGVLVGLMVWIDCECARSWKK
jgi:hypothetical protein